MDYEQNDCDKCEHLAECPFCVPRSGIDGRPDECPMLEDNVGRTWKQQDDKHGNH
jgi:hypothetical protein